MFLHHSHYLRCLLLCTCTLKRNHNIWRFTAKSTPCYKLGQPILTTSSIKEVYSYCSTTIRICNSLESFLHLESHSKHSNLRKRGPYLKIKKNVICSNLCNKSIIQRWITTVSYICIFKLKIYDTLIGNLYC